MNPAHWTIRSAEPGDAAALASLRYEFRSVLGEAVEPRDGFMARATLWIADRLRSGRWIAWVAVDGASAIVGHCFLQIVEKIPNPVEESEWIGYVTNVYVQPHARRCGIAGRLLEAALDHCRSGGGYSVVLWPTDESRAMYERRGFVAPERLMELTCSTNIPSTRQTSTEPPAA